MQISIIVYTLFAVLNLIVSFIIFENIYPGLINFCIVVLIVLAAVAASKNKVNLAIYLPTILFVIFIISLLANVFLIRDSEKWTAYSEMLIPFLFPTIFSGGVIVTRFFCVNELLASVLLVLLAMAGYCNIGLILKGYYSIPTKISKMAIITLFVVMAILTMSGVYIKMISVL